MSPENTSVDGIAGVFILYYLLFVYSEKLFNYFVVFVVISLSIYFPIYLAYGSLNSGIVSAFLETNIDESFSFLKKLELSSLAFPIIFIYFSFILMKLKKYSGIDRNHQDKKQKVLNFSLILVLLLIVFYAPTRFYFNSEDKADDQPWTLANSPINILSFYFNIYDSFSDYYKEKRELEQASTLPPPWQIISSSPKYKNYVLVIGESMRKDYLSTYGFKLPTSPFLDNTKGYINEGYISAAPATYHSLLHTLYFRKDEKSKIDYSYNIITLAKAAGIQTSWISNQGSLGRYDTVASRIGSSANTTIFTKKGGFNTAQVDDSKLLELFKQEIVKQSEKSQSRLFILHLMGSHQVFCDRLTEQDERLEFINKTMSCYVSSILKTDKLIGEIVSTLKEQGESYSLIYFSDHGLSHINRETKDEIALDYEPKFKQSYQVPFFKISSDDKERNIVNVKRSAFNFIFGFAQWLGIKSTELNNDYDFFSDIDDKNIKVFNFEKMVNFDELEQDKIPELK